MNCLTVTDKEVIVNVTDFIKLDGYVQHLQELYRTLHDLSHELETKTVRFDFSMDCQPIRFFAFDRVFEHIATTYAIPKHRMIVKIWDHYPLFESPWVTVVTEPSSNWLMAAEYIKLDKCILNADAKLFGGFYGRCTTHRFLMSYFLETEIKDHSVVAFHPSVEWAEKEFSSVRQWYNKEFEWLYQRASQQLSQVQSGYNGRIDMYAALQDYHNIFKLCHIEIVLETNYYENGWFSEKTTRCLCAGKPFILMGTHGQLNHVKDIGFKTFSPWIDESYNNEANTEKRFDLVREEIKRISNLSKNQQQELVKEITLIAEYNKQNYEKIINDYKRTFDRNH
jgi:hypothetical protein